MTGHNESGNGFDHRESDTSLDSETKQGYTNLQIHIKHQYIKDLSFESPKSPGVFAKMQRSPEISISIDVSAQYLQENDYEVELALHARGVVVEETAFIMEIKYAGIFSFGTQVPNNILQPILLVECPRLLFPFARNIIAQTTRDGGFPPLMINPIDFGQLYRRRLDEVEKEKKESKKEQVSKQ